MKSIMLLGLAWAVVICATPGLADHFQSQSMAMTRQAHVTGRDVCPQDKNQVIPARFDRSGEMRADRNPPSRQIDAGFSTLCGRTGV